MAILKIDGFDGSFDELEDSSKELEVECPECGNVITVCIGKKTVCPHCGTIVDVKS